MHRSCGPELDFVPLLLLDGFEGLLADRLLDHGLHSFAHTGGTADEELSVLFEEDLLDQIGVLAELILHVDSFGVGLTTEGKVELGDDTFLFELMHLVAVDEILVVPAAAEVQVRDAKRQISIGSLRCLTLLHEAKERHNTGAGTDHDYGDVMRRGHHEVRSIAESHH